MIALLQRVARASVIVNKRTIGTIDRGLLLFVCAERGDTQPETGKLLGKILSYRVFPDEAGKMNLNVAQVGGGLLIVSQFTLAADTNSGTRPSFSPAAEPALGKQLYEHFVAQAKAQHPVVATGEFGADMQVHLVNDGPVTFWLRVPPKIE
ncbi:MAG: D-aminoacyl-tRNA deacylase [Burkholderiaceae bacterium]